MVDTFTGNGVQTAFTLSSTPTSNAYISVNLNGVIQTHGTYSLSGSVLTMSTAPSNGALLEVQTWNMGAGIGGLTVYSDTFTGTGSQVNFTLSTTPASINNTTVVIDGVSQLRAAYSVSGTTLTFTAAPVSGASIQVTTISSAAGLTSSKAMAFNIAYGF